MKQTHLAGYLAIHHHKNNLAMLFTHPSPKVRLLLSYVLFEARREMEGMTAAVFYRSVISQCRLEFEQIAAKYRAGDMYDEDVLRLSDLLVAKAEAAHKALMEVIDV